MDSILTSVKKALGIDEEYDCFDMDIIMHINTALSVLTQIGVGPKTGYQIEDASATWSDYLGDDKRLNMVKSYMYLKVRSIWDPPQTTSVLENINKQISEMEWRINVAAESSKEDSNE